MNLHLNDKVAIITGASYGLGKAIALCLAKEGAKVAISGRNQSALEQAKIDIESFTGGEVLAIIGDMSNTDSVTSMIEQVVIEFGSVHILVNNVGKAFRGLFTTMNKENWQTSFEVNVMSAVCASKAVIPYMKRQKWGRIVNITALSATEPGCELAVSNAAKSALLSMSKTLSRELAKDNILVNCVAPGLIDTPQNDDYFSSTEREEMNALIPLGRYGTTEELAGVVTFLCSERASYITGVNLTVDGGLSRGF